MEWYLGHPIYIATKEWQRRKHRKKRINKKWLKRYGTYELNLMPHEQVLMMDDGVIWMTKKTWLQLKPALERFNPELPERRGTMNKMEKDYEFSPGFIQDLRALAKLVVLTEDPDSVAEITISNDSLDIIAEIRFRFEENGKI